MRLFFGKLVLSMLVLVMLCCSCSTGPQATIDTEDGAKTVEAGPVAGEPAEAKPPEKTAPEETGEPTKASDFVGPEREPVVAQKEPIAQPVVEETDEQPRVVAEIGDYQITDKDLEQRLIKAHQGGRDESAQRIAPVDTQTVLLKMIAEKAMVIQGRQEGLLELDDAVTVKERNEDQLLSLLVKRHLEGKVNVTESEIAKAMKANPKVDRARAKMMVERKKTTRLTEQFRKQLYERRNVKIVNINLPKAAQLHQRLFHRPQQPRSGWWITWTQVGAELSEQERSLVLATFDGGQVVWDDWFRVLHKMAPLKRPKDLGTKKGVERLLERALSRQVFLAEARSRQLDKDEGYQSKARAQEDRHLRSKFSSKAYEGLSPLTKPQMRAYFDEHKEGFRKPDTVKVDVVWCADLATARKVKEELAGDKDFAAVREQYSLKKNEAAYKTTVMKEGVFFEDLWNAEPGTIVGPIKGFFPKRENRRVELLVKWRIVKVIEKKPGKVQEYSSGVAREVKGKMRRQQREAVMVGHRKKLLEKYPYKIYAERLKGVNPFEKP
jgi:hypothetical protein